MNGLWCHSDIAMMTYYMRNDDITHVEQQPLMVQWLKRETQDYSLVACPRENQQWWQEGPGNAAFACWLIKNGSIIF